MLFNKERYKRKIVDNLLRYMSEKVDEAYGKKYYNEMFGELEHKLKINGSLKNIRKYARKLGIPQTTIDNYISDIGSSIGKSVTSPYEKFDEIRKEIEKY